MLAEAVRNETCDLDWSPIESAHATSEFCTFLAGFVFTGMVLVITERRNHEERQAIAALKLLLGAFLPLGLCAYLVGDTSGERNCDRALHEEVLTGDMLGIGATTVVIAIVWLLSAYRRHEAVRLARRVCYLALGAVTLLNGTASLSFAQQIQVQGLLHQSSIWIAGSWSLFTGALLVIARYFPKMSAEPSAQSVDRTVTVILAQAGLLGLADGLLMSSPVSWDEPYWLLWTIFIATLTLPTISLVLLIRVMPHADHLPKPNDGPEPSQSVEVTLAPVEVTLIPRWARWFSLKEVNGGGNRIIPDQRVSDSGVNRVEQRSDGREPTGR